jgi:hypothetical protein
MIKVMHLMFLLITLTTSVFAGGVKELRTVYSNKLHGNVVELVYNVGDISISELSYGKYGVLLEPDYTFEEVPSLQKVTIETTNNSKYIIQYDRVHNERIVSLYSSGNLAQQKRVKFRTNTFPNNPSSNALHSEGNKVIEELFFTKEDKVLAARSTWYYDGTLLLNYSHIRYDIGGFSSKRTQHRIDGWEIYQYTYEDEIVVVEEDESYLSEYEKQKFTFNKNQELLTRQSISANTPNGTGHKSEKRVVYEYDSSNNWIKLVCYGKGTSISVGKSIDLNDISFSRLAEITREIVYSSS